MKKLLGILPTLFIIFTLVLPFSVLAETRVGIKPGSIFYSFDLLGEKIVLFFTRDPYEKAKKLLLNADERIAEIKASEDNQKSATKAANEFSNDISQSFKSFDNIKENAKKIGFLISFENRYKEHWATLMSLYNNLPEEDQPIFREKLVAYNENLKKGLDVVKEIESKKGQTPDTNNKSNSQNVADELSSTKRRLAILEQQQKPKTVTELKKQDPEQYKSLVSENKSKLVEASKTLENKKIIAKVKPAVAHIETASGSAGSGIVVSSDGFILTNAHVVTSENSATVKLTDGRSFTASVVGRDENIDLALLKVSGVGLTSATLGDSDSVEQGDPVFTLGYPFGIEGDVSFKVGILSSHRKIEGITYLEISAQILPGNSGGPLVDQSGEVVGVNTWAQGGAKIAGVLIGETLKYAMPINIAKSLIPDLKTGRNVVIPKPSIKVPTPSPTPSPSQPILPPSIYTPTPEPRPEPVRTTISSVVTKEESYGIVISWDSNKSTSYGGWRVLIGRQNDLSDAIELKPTYKSATYSPVSENTTYYYQVFVKDACTQCLSYDPVEAKSDIFSIKTMKTKPSITSLDISYPSSSSVVISITTDIGADSELKYKRQLESEFFVCFGPKTNDHIRCDSITGATGNKTTHSYTFTGVPGGIVYEYRVEVASDVLKLQLGNFTDFKTGTFSTNEN